MLRGHSRHSQRGLKLYGVRRERTRACPRQGDSTVLVRLESLGWLQASSVHLPRLSILCSSLLQARSTHLPLTEEGGVTPAPLLGCAHFEDRTHEQMVPKTTPCLEQQGKQCKPCAGLVGLLQCDREPTNPSTQAKRNDDKNLSFWFALLAF